MSSKKNSRGGKRVLKRQSLPLNISMNVEPRPNFMCYTNGQSMIPAFSDPAMMYPYHQLYPVAFPPTATSLPPYNHCQTPTMCRSHVPSSRYRGKEPSSLPCVNPDDDDDDSSSSDDDDDVQNRLNDPAASNGCNDLIGKESMLVVLMDQVNVLKEANHRLSHEMQELRSEMVFLKQQFMSRHVAVDKEYEPGMLSDIVREIRDAARIREDALMSKVKHLIDDRQMAMNQLHLAAERSRNNERIEQLEEQVRILSVNNTRRRNALRLFWRQAIIQKPALSTPTSANIFRRRPRHPPSLHHPSINSASALSKHSTEITPKILKNEVSDANQVLELEQINLSLRRELQELKTMENTVELNQLLRSLQHQKFDSLELASNEETKTTTATAANAMDNCSLTTKSASPVARVLSGPVTSL